MHKSSVKKTFAVVLRSRQWTTIVFAGILIIVFLTQCKEQSTEVEVDNEVLLSKIIIPAGYQVLYKGRYHPEGESSMHGDSIYIIKKDGDTLSLENRNRKVVKSGNHFYKPRDPEINLIIKHIDSDQLKENADDIFARSNKHLDMLTYDNSSTKIHEKKVNIQKSLWYINYSYGQHKPDFFYLERRTSDCYIILNAREHKLSSKEIRLFYTEVSKF